MDALSSLLVVNGRRNSVRTTDNTGRRAPHPQESLFYVAPPIVIHFNNEKFAAENLANVNSCSCSLYVVVRPSVCRLSVTPVHPTQPIEIFGNVSAPFNTLLT